MKNIRQQQFLMLFFVVHAQFDSTQCFSLYASFQKPLNA
jgi:hypothetical protein